MVMTKLICGLSVSILFISACSSQQALMPTPNVYKGVDAKTLFSDVPDSLKGHEIDLFYVTDRKPEKDENGQLIYGFQRSDSLAFGTTTISLLPELSWKELEQVSLQETRSPEITLNLTGIKELGRFPATPHSIVRKDGLLLL
jgi:esterase/lipase superfamily enzyme